MQNFHYQTDGYFSDHSAAVYDFQVEVLFKGGADAMRRQALLPVAEFCATGRSARSVCWTWGPGTGRFLGFVKHNYPRLPVIGVDLSAAYLRRARRDLQHVVMGRPGVGRGGDVAVCRREFRSGDLRLSVSRAAAAVRERAAAEFARVLRPRGRLVLVNSFQRGDEPGFDGLLELFPLAYHEPYFADYVRHDLRALFEGVGLRPIGAERAHMSKIMTFDKPA